MSHEDNAVRGRGMWHGVLVVCLMAACGLQTTTARADGTGLGTNAALRYWQAFAVMPELTTEQEALVRTWKAIDLGDKSGSVVKSSGLALRLLHQGAATGACDWSVDWENGVSAALPHLGKARRLARLAMLRARHRLAEGKKREAVSDALACIALARHVGTDGAMVQSLVCWAIEDDAIGFLGEKLADMDRASLRELSTQLAKLPSAVTFSDAMRGERRFVADWLLTKLRKEGLERTLQAAQRVFGKAAMNQDDMTKAKAIAILESFAGHFNDLAEAGALPPEKARAALARIAKKVQSPKNKMLAPGMPAIIRAYEVQVVVAERRLRLQAAIARRLGG